MQLSNKDTACCVVNCSWPPKSFVLQLLVNRFAVFHSWWSPNLLSLLKTGRRLKNLNECWCCFHIEYRRIQLEFRSDYCNEGMRPNCLCCLILRLVVWCLTPLGCMFQYPWAKYWTAAFSWTHPSKCEYVKARFTVFRHGKNVFWLLKQSRKLVYKQQFIVYKSKITHYNTNILTNFSVNIKSLNSIMYIRLTV